MGLPLRPLIPAVLAATLAAFAAATPGPGDEAENYRRLAAMPRERRVVLAENLEQFDRLDPKEQAAIRKLDARLARMDPIEQARYRATLRRYHLWVAGLADAQKQELAATSDPNDRFTLARKFRLRDGETLTRGTPRVAGIRTGDYGLIGPVEVAYLLKAWQKLPAAQRVQVGKRPGKWIQGEVSGLASKAGARQEPFTRAEENAYDTRLEADPDFKALLGPAARRIAEAQKAEALRKAESEAKAGKVEEPAKKGVNPQRLFEHPYAEFLHFEEHRPRPVDPKNFERFAGSCPAWLLSMIEPLSPEDARDYLTIVYRLIYPHPAEMPEAKPGPAGAAPTSTPRKPGPAGAPL